MESLKLLEWDTAFFGFPVAKIVNPSACAEELRDCLSQMRARRIPLAYWAAATPGVDVHELALSLGGRLVDEKQTFVADLSQLPARDLAALPGVEPYREGMSMTDLKQLAIDSGIYSRFIVDPQFPHDKAIALFEEWIVRSVNKSIAEEVLVTCHETSVSGMATLARKEGRGSIGLVAVAASFRGRKLGEALVYSAQDWCRKQSLGHIQVTTQFANLPARCLYQKCGFELEKTEAFYHFWSGIQNQK